MTWQAVAATEFMRASTGAGSSGQDARSGCGPRERRRGTSRATRTVSGQVVQELWPRRYDFQARWFGVYEVKSAVAIPSTRR